MKTAVLSTDSIDDQMATTADGEKMMKIGTGANAADKPDNAVAEEPAAAKPAANATAPAARVLADA